LAFEDDIRVEDVVLKVMPFLEETNELSGINISILKLFVVKTAVPEEYAPTPLVTPKFEASLFKSVPFVEKKDCNPEMFLNSEYNSATRCAGASTNTSRATDPGFVSKSGHTSLKNSRYDITISENDLKIAICFSPN
jgi:hypothetical protein